MKLILGILLSIFLHPVAVILALVNVAGREDHNAAQKVLWAVFIIVFWGIGPVVYILFGGGSLW
ncbi:MAG: hypothetical protein QOK05_1758 [Chloroflexota bacterium]|nr:hypothetical protein [Chloroflexota bacterium]